MALAQSRDERRRSVNELFTERWGTICTLGWRGDRGLERDRGLGRDRGLERNRET